jgi:hypothetical protein
MALPKTDIDATASSLYWISNANRENNFIQNKLFFRSLEEYEMGNKI